MPPEVIIPALSGALVAVALTFFKFLTDRIKRSEEREDRRDRNFDKIADLLEAHLGVKVPRD